MDKVDREEPSSSTRLSSALGRELGEELRRLRAGAGLSGTALAAALGWSPGRLSKLEGGVRGTSPWQIAVLVGHCRADDVSRDRIARIVEAPDTGSFLRRNEPSADSLTALAVHERLARTVSVYEPLTIPSLLQTDHYAHAVTGDPDTVKSRMQRQELLLDRADVTMCFYVHEAALRQVVGGAKIMAEQLRRLAVMGSRADVVVRVVPLDADGDATVRHGSTLLTFQKPIAPVAYMETDTATIFQDDPRAVAVHAQKLDRLSARALSVEESTAMLVRQAERYERQISS